MPLQRPEVVQRFSGWNYYSGQNGEMSGGGVALSVPAGRIAVVSVYISVREEYDDGMGNQRNREPLFTGPVGLEFCAELSDENGKNARPVQITDKGNLTWAPRGDGRAVTLLVPGGNRVRVFGKVPDVDALEINFSGCVFRLRAVLLDDEAPADDVARFLGSES
jgi:hypothetical protein